MGNESREGGSDNDLLGRIADGDPLSLRLLMDRYDRLIRYTVYRASRERCRRDPLWLDSVCSEVWTDLCRSLRINGNPGIDNIHSYLIQIARRRSIDALRRPGAAPLGAGEDESVEQSQPVYESEDTSDLLSGLEEVSALRECMMRLKEPDRVLCGEIAAITSGQWKEAAGRLAMPESTLRSRWSRVLDRLRTCLEKKEESSRAGRE